MIDLSQSEIVGGWANHIDDEPLVSIKCMTFNHDKYISQALDGFLMQKTNFPFEVLIHDDASTDKTVQIIKEYENKYPRIIKPIYEEENQYKTGTHHVKINALLKGKYLAFCEGDDYWIDPMKLQKQIDFLENNPDYGMCYTDFNIYYQSKNRLVKNLMNTQPEKYKAEYKTLEEWIIDQGYTAPMTWVYKIDLLKGYDNLKTVDGTFVLFAHFLANTKVKCLKEWSTATYRVLSESASHSRSIENIYNRRLNLYHTQLKMINLYKADNEISGKITEQFYKQNIKVFSILNKNKDLEISKKYDLSIFSKLIVFLSKYSLCRALFKITYICKKTLEEKL